MKAAPGHPTAGGEGESSSRRGCAAYSLGRILNKVGWRLDQAIFFPDEALPGGRVNALLGMPVSLVRRLFTDPDSAHVEELLNGSISRWEGVVGAEDIGAEIESTIKWYTTWNRDPFSEPDFTDATGYGRSILDKVIDGVRSHLEGEPFLLALLEFGILVDQGLRPQETTPSVFQYRERGHRYRISMKYCPVAETPLDPNWALEVRSRWKELELPDGLPQPLFDLHYGHEDMSAVEAIVKSIDEAVKERVQRLGASHEPSVEIPAFERTKSIANHAPAEQAVQHRPEPDGWLVGSRRQLNKALGKSETYSKYLENEAKKGTIELSDKRTDGKFSIRVLDPQRCEQAAKKLQEMQR